MKILAPLFAIPLVGCSYLQLAAGVTGSGHAKTEVRVVTRFTAIRHDAVGDPDVRIGPTTKVSVSADDNLLSKIHTKIEKGTLVISTNENFHPKTPVKFTITVPALDRLDLNGIGHMKAHQVHGRTMVVKMNGTGDLSVDGSVDELSIELNGVGDANLKELTARQVDVKSNGTGNTSVTATKRISITLNGVGDVRYSGRPQSVTVKKNGMGDIQAL